MQKSDLSKKVSCGRRIPAKKGAMWLWLITFLILLQNLFPLQTHTRVVLDHKGETLVVCTLDGYQVLADAQSDLQTLDATTQSSDFKPTQRSAAFLFSSLLAHTDVHVAPILPFALFSEITSPPEATFPQYLAQVPNYFRARAPPLI